MKKETKIIIFSALGVIVAAVLCLIVIEESKKRTISIANHTDKDITSLSVMFETEDESEEILKLYEGALKKGESYKGSFEKIDFKDITADIGMLVTFDGEEEIFLYDGLFYNRFDGTIEIEFHQEEGQYRVLMNAYSGLFKNGTKTNMKNDDFYFDFEESDFYMVGDEDVFEESFDDLEFDDWDEYDDFDEDEYDEQEEYDDLFLDEED